MDDLKVQVQRLIDAGVPEPEIGAFIKRNAAAVPASNPQVTGETPRIRSDNRMLRGASNFARESMRAGGLVAGGIVGGAGGTAVAGPGVGTAGGAVVGAGLGYSMADNLADRLDEFIGLADKIGIVESTKRAVEDIDVGMRLEMGGQAIPGGLAMSKGAIMSLAEKTGVTSFVKKAKELFPTMSNAGMLKKARQILEDVREGGKYDKSVEESEALLGRLGVKTQPTFGQKAEGATRASAFEQSMAARDSELASILKQNDAQINAEAIETVNKKFGDSGGTASDVIEGISTQFKAVEGKAAQAALDAERSAAGLKLAKNPQETGYTIRSVLKELKKAARLIVDEAYAKIPQDVKLSLKPVIEGLSSIKADFKKIGGGSESMPSEIMDEISNAALKTSEVNFNQLRDWRSRIGEDLSQLYSSQNPNRRLGRRLKMLEESVNKAMDQLLSSGRGDVSEKYKAASNLYKEYSKKFNSGSVGKVLRGGRESSGFAIADSEIPQRFFKTGKLDSADDLIRAVGDKKAGQMIDDFVSFDLAARTWKGDRLNTQQAMKWLSNNKIPLKKFGIYEKYAKIIKDGKIADDISAELSTYSKTLASRVIGTNVETLIPSIFGGANSKKNASVMYELINMPGMKGNTAAQNGLKVAFKDFMLKKMENSGVDVLGNPLMSIAKGKKVLEEFGQALRVLYKDEPEKIAALYDYHKLLNMLARNKNVSFSGGSTTAEKMATIRKDIAGGLIRNTTQFVAVAKGSGWFINSMGNFVKAIAGAPGKLSEAQIEIILKEAIHNPDVAATVMAAVGRYRGKINVGASLKHHALTLGIYTTRRAKEALEE